MSAVYSIECRPTKKYYIGRSDDPCKRFMQHKKALSNDKHYNLELQADYKKYGKDAFEFKILAYCYPQDSHYMELGYMAVYLRHGYKLYNYPSIKDQIVWKIIEWSRKHQIKHLQVDYNDSDCMDKKSLNWNLLIKHEEKTILINLYNSNLFEPEGRLEELKRKNQIRADYCDSKGYYLISEDYNDQIDPDSLSQWIELQIVWICKK